MSSEDSMQEDSGDSVNRSKKEARKSDDESENGTSEHEAENEMDQNDKLDASVVTSSNSKRSMKLSPVPEEEREQTVNPTGNYQGRTLLNRHGGLSQERKRLLNVLTTITRNSPLTPQPIKEGESLSGLLNDTPDSSSDNAAIQLFNAQNRALRDKVKSLIQECAGKEEAVLLLEGKLKETKEERDRLLRNTSIKQQLIEKYQKISDENRSRAIELDNQCTSLRKEVEILEQGQKQFAAIKTAAETRLNRAYEEIEKLKSDLRMLKQSAKEARDRDKRRIEELAADNKCLQKETKELLAAFTKQMKLIDNLKRQKMHLEATKALQLTEEEFMRALDWGS